MLHKRNLLESLTVISCSGSLICVLLNLLVNISRINGVWFLAYILLLFFGSITFSFKFIQWLLHFNKPIKYDLDGLVKKYPILNSLTAVIPKARDKSEDVCADYDTNQLSIISSVLERKLVSSWYIPYISQEISFPFACKQMLDQMIGRTFQISNKIETKDVYISVCAILTTHLKEYKKTMKRYEKSPTSPLESHYKKSHQIFSLTDKKLDSTDHCTNVLRIILKELVPWELWDIPHSELLIRILSKRLACFINNTLSNPVWLNDKLLTILKGKDVKKNIDFEKKSEENKEKLNFEKLDEAENNSEVLLNSFEKKVESEIPSTNTIDSANLDLINDHTASIQLRQEQEEILRSDCENGIEVEKTMSIEPVDNKSSPILRQRRGRQGKDKIKIYDRVIEGSVKTWETDVDLQCISLGQDLLASLNGEITLSRLWGQEDGDTKNDQLWFGEEDNLDLEDTSPKNRSPVKKEHSPKPAELLKDLQTTVHQAKTKIGDLQVSPVHVQNNDEAAGMMEGLLDFGIAGLKKGLRFTGLSDDSQEKSPSHKERGDKSPPQEMKLPAHSYEHKDIITTSVSQKEDIDMNGAPHLIKQHRLPSQDSVPITRPMLRGEQPIPESESPEPEYEEAADLSTSIAKLRSLLNQRALHERGDDVWWEVAEETRGRIQQHHSTKPVDTATLADEYDMNADRNTSPGQSSNNMQRLDKLIHRTVTGVFNSIKTAVGVEGVSEENIEDLTLYTATDWSYVCTSIESSLGYAMGRVAECGRASGRVEAARDSLDQLPGACRPAETSPEDFEEWCASVGAGWSALAELLSTLGLANTHVTYRIATTVFADLVETLITLWLDDLTLYLRKEIFVFFEQLSNDSGEVEKEHLRNFNLEETHALVMEKIPVSALYIFGEDTISNAVKLSLTSFSHQEINKDVILRILDLFALHFKKSAGNKNISFDSN